MQAERNDLESIGELLLPQTPEQLVSRRTTRASLRRKQFDHHRFPRDRRARGAGAMHARQHQRDNYADKQQQNPYPDKFHSTHIEMPFSDDRRKTTPLQKL